MAFSFIDLGGIRHTRDQVPSECPVCHFAVQAEEGQYKLAKKQDETVLEIVFSCPRPECGHLFIAHYNRVFNKYERFAQFILAELTPTTPVLPIIPEEIKAVSDQFSEIYAQAMAAESFGLDQIAGMGFRKALEFLVKDYCISLRPEASEQIKTILLSVCINNYVTDPNVKICANRAAWLGNDETHYQRKWVNKDISDLKQLIRLTLNWIESAIVTQKYLSEMP